MQAPGGTGRRFPQVKEEPEGRGTRRELPTRPSWPTEKVGQEPRNSVSDRVGNLSYQPHTTT
jgi:hypothetical protein